MEQTLVKKSRVSYSMAAESSERLAQQQKDKSGTQHRAVRSTLHSTHRWAAIYNTATSRLARAAAAGDVLLLCARTRKLNTSEGTATIDTRHTH